MKMSPDCPLVCYVVVHLLLLHINQTEVVLVLVCLPPRNCLPKNEKTSSLGLFTSTRNSFWFILHDDPFPVAHCQHAVALLPSPVFYPPNLLLLIIYERYKTNRKSKCYNHKKYIKLIARYNFLYNIFDYNIPACQKRWRPFTNKF